MKFSLKKPTKRQVEKFALNSIIIVFGNALAAMGAAFFIVPEGLGFVMGGTTGIGILVRNLLGLYSGVSATVTEWIVQIVVWVGNIALFVIGIIFLGKKFAMGTLAGTLLYPGFLSLFNLCNKLYANSGLGESIGESLGDPLLSAIFGGLLFGLGIAIVVRVGASTGGTDIPPLIFQKYFNVPISMSLWAIDGAIILLQFTAWPAVTLSQIGYGIVITLLTSITVAKVSPIGMRRTQVKIISNHYLEIRDMILTKISRGVTVLYGQTGYLKEDCHMLLTVISRRQLVQLKSEVHRIDPEAFMTISEVSEVRGRGFHSDGVDFLMKEDREEEEIAPPPKGKKEGGDGEN